MKATKNFFARFRRLVRLGGMTAHRNQSDTLSDGPVEAGLSLVDTNSSEHWIEEQSGHPMIANSVDHVLEIWSHVGLATLMAEIRGARVQEIVEILEDLAAAGHKAASALREASAPAI